MQAHVTPPPRQQARSSTQAALDAVREHPYTAAGAAAALLAACGLLYYRHGLGSDQFWDRWTALNLAVWERLLDAVTSRLSA